MIPLRATNYKLSGNWPPAIIIHHSACKFSIPELEMDKTTFQTGKLNTINYSKYRKETGFNFIIERVDDDFQAICSQPLMTKCEYDDIDEKYWTAVHICLMGNYNKDIPMNRMYKVLSYRVLAPLMRLFIIKEDDILFHSTISNKEISCPGEFVDKEKILMSLRNVLKRMSVTRRTA
jgi:hypothetical protein